ncbi:hypothetical protein DERF_011424 [Dermatophagoides farinae]|uniref:Uncharacterized protein n=1 Tax=Dermatophagoides farinae TaxID=6954 RepID=A0A922HS62_DERFA|nr:hypothetical protein DERF_011424 [Dermatophagoides farinae]
MSKYLATTPLTFSLLFYTSLITSIFEVMSARLPDIYWNSTNPIPQSRITICVRYVFFSTSSYVVMLGLPNTIRPYCIDFRINQ